MTNKLESKCLRNWLDFCKALQSELSGTRAEVGFGIIEHLGFSKNQSNPSLLVVPTAKWHDYLLLCDVFLEGETLLAHATWLYGESKSRLGEQELSWLYVAILPITNWEDVLESEELKQKLKDAMTTN